MVVEINEYHPNKNKRRLFIVYFLTRESTHHYLTEIQMELRKFGSFIVGVGGGKGEGFRVH